LEHSFYVKGNRFVIALRNVNGDKIQIDSNLKSLKEYGFINYYGTECFGTRTHLIGKQLLLNQWKEVRDKYLSLPTRSHFAVSCRLSI
jgi:tRNA pseudouridine13 synthase